MEYKNTLNLPQTDFPMKADLVTREPKRLEHWNSIGLYQQIQERRKGAPLFVLHDGPPFANGDVHIGTALNKTLKDMVIRYKSLRGFNAPYVPGWDCHGLPIEFKVSQDMRKAGDTQTDPVSIRKACEVYARKYIDIQRAQFKRLGVLGDWENPYLTLNREFEADELRLFADIVAKGFVYRGKKPVYWSIPCRTALAEAEVEYHDHVSQSVYVKFPVVGQEKTFVVIWTTTPWTLPANLAVAYNTTFQYVKATVNGEHYIVFRGLLPKLAELCGWTDHQETALPVEELATLHYQHPFCQRTGKLFAGDAFVTADTGTGFVHIAPGHGLEDYNLGRQNDLPIYSPVDDDGCLTYTNDFAREKQMPAELIGKSILAKHGKSEANEAVLHELRTRNVLLHQANYHHSYPFCWRSKTPVIFRAMNQWFIRIDHDQFRQRAIAEIDRVTWVPDWGVNRIKGAVQSRPDWCISRQRTWGVPIPAFYDAEGNDLLNAELILNTAALIEAHGSNIWFEMDLVELWSKVKPANWTGPTPVSKSNDTLDVWIDSGSSSRSVLMRRPELNHGADRGTDSWQADIYLEGSDQHRGWFQSSLLLSFAGNGAAPFKTVLTHGFMVDADREKISKSKQGQGGYEKPQTSEAYIGKYGADVVRLWVASQDYRSDIVVSEERLGKVSETYRGIRNTLRYQLSNLFDFDPSKHAVPDEKLTGLDRWILDAFTTLENEVVAAYDAYEFHVVYQKVSQFIAVELSAIYHDVVKDRLYTDAANSHRRRSTQTTLHRLVAGLCKILSPMLVFTTDEAWEYLPGKGTGSVHQADWNMEKTPGFKMGDEERAIWKALFGLREAALPELEKARQTKLIGKGLDAKLTMAGSSPELTRVSDKGEWLRELLNVSQLQFSPGAETVTTVAKADGQKCERCWHWETDVGHDAEHPTLCLRCVGAVKENTAR